VNKRLAIVAGTIALAVLILTGCAEAYQKYNDPSYVPSANELTRIAVEWPDGDPLKPTAQAVALERYATAAAAESVAEQAEATRQAADAQAQQQYRYMTAVAQATAEAHQREMEQRWQWATQQAANATQVAEATAMAISVEMTAQALAIEATAQQRAFEATATADTLNRQATATTEARNAAATATAQHQADVATATQQAWKAKTTATAEVHTATAMAAHATMTRQAERREETLGYARDYGIPIVLLILGGGMIALLVYAARQHQKRPIVYPRNVLGDAEPMAVPQEGGGYTFVDLDRQPGPAIRVLPNGIVQAPLLRSAQQEERTTARDQWIDGQARPRIGAGHQGGGRRPDPPLPLAPPPEPGVPGLQRTFRVRRVDLLGPGKANLLPDGMIRAIEAAWEETQDDDNTPFSD